MIHHWYLVCTLYNLENPSMDKLYTLWQLALQGKKPWTIVRMEIFHKMPAAIAMKDMNEIDELMFLAYVSYTHEEINWYHTWQMRKRLQLVSKDMHA